MKTWTTDASEHFETWLGRVRASVAGDPSVDAEDVAQDLRAHVHAELEASPEPVTVGAVEHVLASLGNPAQWSDSLQAPPRARGDWFTRHVVDVVSEWQKKLAGDSALPLLLVVLTGLAIPTFDEGTGIALMALAYFVARAQVTHAPQTIAGRKKWIFYFPLALGAGVLAGLVLGFPLFLRGGSASFSDHFEALWVLGSWWILVGVLAAREPRRVRWALAPFASAFDRSHGHTLALVGAAFMITATVILLAA